jgi:hypothetical protein
MATEALVSKTFTTGEALAIYRRVKFSSSTIVYADQADENINVIGVTMEAAASGAQCGVGLTGGGRTFKCTAADSFSAGATLYAADDGKVSDTAYGAVIGIALEAADGANAVVECFLYTYTGASTETISVPMTDFRVWDAVGTNLPVAAATNDDLALITNTSTCQYYLATKDYGGTTDGVQYATALVAIPDNYIAADDLKIRVKCAAVAVADAAMTVDIAATEVGSTTDIVATTAQSINSTTAATKDFTLTATNVAPGDVLAVRLAVAVNDSGDASANIQGTITNVWLLADCLQN